MMQPGIFGRTPVNQCLIKPADTCTRTRSVCHTCTIPALHFFFFYKINKSSRKIDQTHRHAGLCAGFHATVAPQRRRGSPECAGLGTWQRQGRSVQRRQLGHSSPEEHALVGTIRRPRLRPSEPRRASLLGEKNRVSSVGNLTASQLRTPSLTS